jgi:hypothetical protein
MSEPLYKAVQSRARRNGQSVRRVLEQAVAVFLEASQPPTEIHADIVARARRAIRKHRTALELLAKAG